MKLPSIRTDRLDENLLHTVASRIRSGNTILFLGAGFTRGAVNELAKDIPTARDFSIQICKLGKMEEDPELTYTSGQFLKHNQPAQLARLIRSTFKVRNTQNYHKTLARQMWKRVYTTNYDDCFEVAAGECGKRIAPLNLESNVRNNFSSCETCLHLNGFIDDISNDEIPSSFKLSDSSYSHSPAFLSSPWLYRLKKDIESCNQILFVGYSLYDAEIKYVVSESEKLKKKTFFIIAESASRKDINKLSDFGTVFPIGVKRFGELVASLPDTEEPDALQYLFALEQYSPRDQPEFNDTDIRDLLLLGRTKDDYVYQSLSHPTKHFSINRDKCSTVMDTLRSKRCVAIESELANGKSVLLQQVACSLHMNGERVYKLYDENGDYRSDIDKLCQKEGTIYLIVDGVSQCPDVAKYFLLQSGDRGRLVVADRPNRLQRALEELSIQNVYEVNIDTLSTCEIEALAELLTQCGLWADPRQTQIRKLTHDYQSQISLVLSQLLEAPQQIDRLRNTLSTLTKDEETKATLHGICVASQILSGPCRKSFISRITSSDNVLSTRFRKLTEEAGIFRFRNDRLESRSAIFGRFVLRHVFSANYTIDRLIQAVELLDRNYGNLTIEEEDYYRGMMKFGTLAAILPDKDISTSYIKYYETIKRNVPRVINNPHFWLQYAMALMSGNNLRDAESMLNTAYSVAARSHNYDTLYIDNQMARLKLRQASEASRSADCIKFFSEAHNLLKSHPDDIKKFRQAGHYLSFYKDRFSSLGKGAKVIFEHALKEMIEQYKRFLKNYYKGEEPPPFFAENLDDFCRTYDEVIEKTRNSCKSDIH